MIWVKMEATCWWKYKAIIVIMMACTCLPGLRAYAGASLTPPPLSLDWASFLGRADLVWDRLPESWDRGAFTGNGVLGAMTFVDEGALSWELGRVDVVDKQVSDDPMVASPRLPIGFLRWQGCAPLQGIARLDLWNAQAQAQINTSASESTLLTWWVHATRPVMGIAVKRAGCEGRFQFEPAKPISHRAGQTGQPQSNPAVERFSRGERQYSLQKLVGGGAHVVAFETRLKGDEDNTFVTIQVASSAKRAVKLADEALSQAWQHGWSALARSHQAWWHGYYPASFVTLPDTQLENFYWIQMYKLASATRSHSAVIDTLGPWYHQTPWPGLWWNLNVQLSYWPLYTANRLDIARSLVRALIRNKHTLRANAKPLSGMAIGRTSGQDLRSPLSIIDLVRAESPDAPREHGNLMWALHNLWLHAQHAADKQLRRQTLSLIAEATAYYLDLLTPDRKGKLHTPVAISPEYPVAAADTNYDLSLLNWALKTLLDPEYANFSSRSDRIKWASVQQRLAAYPTNDNGFMIGRDTAFERSHRHFSHLLMIYPLGLISPDRPAEREVIVRSLEHWIGFEGALEGYSFVGAAAMSARLGYGDAAAQHLQRLVQGFVRRNTMYTEAGPVIETPLAAAQAIHELLLQTQDKVISVFPAIPTGWRDLGFAHLRAPGAFLVSAQMREGHTQFVRVHSLVGGTCRVKLPSGSALTPQELPRGRWTVNAEGVFEVRLRAGQSVVFASDVGQASPAHNVVPVDADTNLIHAFGTSRRNAWLTGAPANPPSLDASAPLKVPPSAIDNTGAIVQWEMLHGSLSTTFSGNGWEEVLWSHTSCDPCASEAQTWTGRAWEKWQAVKPKAGCFDYKQLLPNAGSKDTIAYVRASIVSPEDRWANLRIGTNDQSRVWLWPLGAAPSDEHTVFLHTGGSKMGADAEVVRVRLHKGVNHLFAKTINLGGGWGACFHFVP